jgi:hypothetical protein
MGGLCHLEIPGLRQNPLAIIGLCHPSSISLQQIRARSKPAEQNQDQKDDNHDAQSTTTVVAGTVEWAATKPTETSNQDDDQDNKQNGSDRHETSPKVYVGLLQCALRRSLLLRQ